MKKVHVYQEEQHRLALAKRQIALLAIIKYHKMENI